MPLTNPLMILGNAATNCGIALTTPLTNFKSRFTPVSMILGSMPRIPSMKLVMIRGNTATSWVWR